MRVLLTAFLWIVFMLAAPATVASDVEKDQPILVLVEKNPWLMAIGSDSPTFALYQSGKVIFWSRNEYWSANLTSRELDNLKSDLKIDEAFAGAKPYYELSYKTDQTTQLFYTRVNGISKTVAVYGSFRNENLDVQPPLKLFHLFEKLVSFSPAAATAWQPEKFEVMIWPYEYAPDASIKWPANWPDISDVDTKKRREGSYSIFLPSSLAQQLSDFLKTRNERGAVEINGKKWSVATRTPFPAEEIWMRPSKED